MEHDDEYIISSIPTNRPLNAEENKNTDDNNKIKSIKLIENEKEEDSDDSNIIDEEKELLNNYLKYQNIVVEKKDEEDKANFQQQLEQFLNEPIVKTIIHCISAILSLVAFILYLVSTYFPLEDFWYIRIIDYFFCVFFNIEFIIKYYLSQHKIAFFFNLNNISDLLACIFPYFSSIENVLLRKIIECVKGLLIFKITKAVIQNFRMSENYLARLLIGAIILSFFIFA